MDIMNNIEKQIIVAYHRRAWKIPAAISSLLAKNKNQTGIKIKDKVKIKGGSTYCLLT
jgi:hypothetical protein